MYLCRWKVKVIDQVHIQTSWKVEACFKPMHNPLPLSHKCVLEMRPIPTKATFPKNCLAQCSTIPWWASFCCKPSGGSPPGGGERELNSILYSMESENSTVAITTSVSPSSSYVASSYSTGTTESGYLSVLYFNARSIISKLDEVRSLTEMHTPELVWTGLHRWNLAMW